MEVPEFIEETSRIEKFYHKDLEKFERDVWYQELKNIPINRYRQIIMQVFRSCKFMPKLADIISIQNELPFGNKVQVEKERVNCNKCKGKSLIFYKKYIANGDKKLEYDYAARCDCRNGEEYVYDGTTINDTEHRSKFYIATANQIGI